MANRFLVQSTMRALVIILFATSVLPQTKTTVNGTSVLTLVVTDTAIADLFNSYQKRPHVRATPIAAPGFPETSTTHGFTNRHSEMGLLVKTGSTALEAITSVTRNSALALGPSNCCRRVAPGKIANLHILTAHSAIDIRHAPSNQCLTNGSTLQQRRRPIGKNADNGSSPEQELRSLVRAWDEATVKGDTSVLDYLLADEFAFIDGPTKAQYIASIAMRHRDTTIESAISENVEVHVYDDTAIVIGIDTIKGKHKGDAFEHKFRYMDVWVKRSGRWQCVKVYSTLRENK